MAQDNQRTKENLSAYGCADGGYTDEGGCWYETATDLIQTGLLHFCACADPEGNLGYVLGGLRLLERLKSGVWKDVLTYTDWRKEVDAHFGSDRSKQFFWYWLDAEELTEHGGAVPGWLSKKGIRLLALLEEWDKLPKEDSDD